MHFLGEARGLRLQHLAQTAEFCKALWLTPPAIQRNPLPPASDTQWDYISQSPWHSHVPVTLLCPVVREQKGWAPVQDWTLESPAHVLSEVLMSSAASSWCRTGSQNSGPRLTAEENHPVKLTIHPAQLHGSNTLCVLYVVEGAGLWPVHVSIT